MMTVPTQNSLVLDAAHAGYPGRPKVLCGVSAIFRAGACTAVVGPNGAGKSTMLRVLLGTLAPSHGRAVLGEISTCRLTDAQRAARFAYVPQQAASAFAFDVEQYVGLGCVGVADGTARPAVRAALDATGLMDRRGSIFDELSGGMKQRAALARALAQHAVRAVKGEPFFVLADEPTASMDPRHALSTLALLSACGALGAGVIAVMHDLALARRWADEAVLLTGEGEIVSRGIAREVMTPATLAPLFGTGFVLAQGGEGAGRVEVLTPVS